MNEPVKHSDRQGVYRNVYGEVEETDMDTIADAICNSAVSMSAVYLMATTYGPSMPVDEWAKLKVRLMSAAEEHRKLVEAFALGVEVLSRVEPAND